MTTEARAGLARRRPCGVGGRPGRAAPAAAGIPVPGGGTVTGPTAVPAPPADLAAGEDLCSTLA